MDIQNELSKLAKAILDANSSSMMGPEMPEIHPRLVDWAREFLRKESVEK